MGGCKLQVKKEKWLLLTRRYLQELDEGKCTYLTTLKLPKFAVIISVTFVSLGRYKKFSCWCVNIIRYLLKYSGSVKKLLYKIQWKRFWLMIFFDENRIWTKKNCSKESSSSNWHTAANIIQGFSRDTLTFVLDAKLQLQGKDNLANRC